MKEIHEYTAEVFHRSEKRIKARRQRRNRILITCIPVVLCLTICGTILLPGVTPTGNSDPKNGVEAMEGMGNSEYTSLSASIAKITVSAEGVSNTCTDTEKIMILLDRLQFPVLEPPEPESNAASAEGDLDNGKDLKEHVDKSDVFSDSSMTVYTITVYFHEGDITKYQLSGNVLKDMTSNETYALSPKQLDELLKLLELLP